MEFAIFDLDGCVSDDRHRRHLLPVSDVAVQPMYDEYHAACYDDHVVADGLAAIRAAERRNWVVVFVTARPEALREITTRWIVERLGIERPTILMRPEGNTQRSPKLKPYLLHSRGVGPDSVAAAFDDRQDVLRAYRDYGIKDECLTLLRVSSRAGTPAPVEPTPEKTVADYLREAAKTAEERNKLYKDNYRTKGQILDLLHGPEAVVPLSEIEDLTTLGLYFQIITKLTRFANSGLTHTDSIRDIIVYAAIIERELQEKGK